MSKIKRTYVNPKYDPGMTMFGRNDRLPFYMNLVRIANRFFPLTSIHGSFYNKRIVKEMMRANV